MCKLYTVNKSSFSISVLYLPDTVGTKHQYEIVALWSSGTGKKFIDVIESVCDVGNCIKKKLSFLLIRAFSGLFLALSYLSCALHKLQLTKFTIINDDRKQDITCCF